MSDHRTADISVILCVYADDRWDDMLAAVDSLRQQELLPKEIVIVVDHNRPLLDRLKERLPDVRIVENTEPRGLSGARNSGICASDGKKVAFLDDDARAEPAWLLRLDRGFDSTEAMGVGGHTLPDWESERPTWFPPSFDWTIGCSYVGLPTELSVVRNPFGGNMLVSREVFESAGGFRTGIGRVGTVPLGGEETELAIRARREFPDRDFLYEPDARIHHKVPSARGTWQYFWRRCYAEGLSKANIARLQGRRTALESENAYLRQTLPAEFTRHLRETLTRKDPTGYRRAGAILLGLAGTGLGYLYGVLRLRTQHNG